jgi:integrase
VRKVARDVAERRLSKGRLALIQGTLRRYLLPFFGKCLIGAIDQADFAEYDEWRLNYWTSGIGADLNVARKAKIPAQQTLAMEQSILRLLFRHAVEQGILEQLPYMTTKRAKTNRRVAFDVKESHQIGIEHNAGYCIRSFRSSGVVVTSLKKLNV